MNNKQSNEPQRFCGFWCEQCGKCYPDEETHDLLSYYPDEEGES